MGNMMGGGMGVGGMFGFAHLLSWVLLIVAVVALVVWLMRGARPGDADRRQDRALAILKERYARGEIDKEEFETRKRDLE